MNHSNVQPETTQPSLDSDRFDVSCRRPVTFLITLASCWLLLGVVLALVGSVKVLWPDFLADSAVATYGRMVAAKNVVLFYGFGIQAALGVCLWLLSRLGRVPLVEPRMVSIGTLFWNLGVAVGFVGVLGGDTTGFEFFELPRYTTPILFVSYALIAACAARTFLAGRSKLNRDSMSISLWFVIASLMWFPWIFLSAGLFLQFFPVRGVLQSLIALWYEHNLDEIVLGFVGLASAFYLVPKLLDRPLYSRPLALFAIWTLALFATCGGIPNGAALPAWIISLSVVGTVLSIVPMLAVGANFILTVRTHLKTLDANLALRFSYVSLVFWLIAWAQAFVGMIPSVSALVGLTSFSTAQPQLMFWGFFAMSLFGAVYHILPQLLGVKWPSDKLASLHFWCFFLGVVFSYLTQLVGGVGQGYLLTEITNPFSMVMKATLSAVLAGVLGEGLILVGLLAFAVNLALMLIRAKPACPVPNAESQNTPRPSSSDFTLRSCFHSLLYPTLFLVLCLSWIGLVMAPVVQLGGLQQSSIVGDFNNRLYPIARPGLAAEGAEIYRANGCVSCHTQQVRPFGIGPDLARGLGSRRPVARDYLFDQPPFLGSQRLGPDLANAGSRLDTDTVLLHLYSPRSIIRASFMPPYRYLFDTRKIGKNLSNEALKLPSAIAPAAGFEIIPKPQARALTAYLLSLKTGGPLYETPMTTAKQESPKPT